VVALSKDDLDDVRMQAERDKLSFPLLSDPNLSVIRQYGLEHHKGVEFSTARFSIAGVPLALVPSVKPMAIPTSLLFDEDGVIRWIDQAEDYRLRGDELRDAGRPGRFSSIVRT
jgi:alkyl hydroperoxide reductase subunit AhpC